MCIINRKYYTFHSRPLDILHVHTCTCNRMCQLFTTSAPNRRSTMCVLLKYRLGAPYSYSNIASTPIHCMESIIRYMNICDDCSLFTLKTVKFPLWLQLCTCNCKCMLAILENDWLCNVHVGICMPMDMVCNHVLWPGYWDSLVEVRTYQQVIGTVQWEVAWSWSVWDAKRGVAGSLARHDIHVLYMYINMNICQVGTGKSPLNAISTLRLAGRGKSHSGPWRQVTFTSLFSYSGIPFSKNERQPLLQWVLSAQTKSLLTLGMCCWQSRLVIMIPHSRTVTQEKAYWALPLSLKQVPFASLRQISMAGSQAALRSSSPRLTLLFP